MKQFQVAKATDTKLLTRFNEARDQDAFAELVRRHGPMVCATARRVLRSREDVDEAFQATMFALAKAAGKLSGKPAVAGWLHKAAFSCAAELQRANIRWKRKTDRMKDRLENSDVEVSTTDPLLGVANEELERILDEELASLSERLRDVIVLCELEGLSQKKVARQLGVPTSTVSDRISKGRKLLHNRLVRRGATLTLAGIASNAASSSKASASMTEEFVADISAKATRYAAGKTASEAGVTSTVVQLADKVITSMKTAKTIQILVAAIAFIIFGGSLLEHFGVQRAALAQLQFGDPVKTANINLGPPISDGSPSMTSDGLTMYLQSTQRPDASYPDGDFYLYVTSRDTQGDEWQAPVPLAVELNQGGDGGPSISSDGLSLYFNRGDEIDGQQPDADLYVATRDTTESAWNSPRPVPNIKLAGWSDLEPEISANGLELYFSSNRPGGNGGPDLWVSRRASVSDPWGQPENLAGLNSANWSGDPDLSEDGLTLLYSAGSFLEGARSIGFDLWVARRKTLTSTWESPVRLPENINDFSAIDPHLSPDGSTLYFAGTLLDTTELFDAFEDMDIWQVPVVPEPSSMVMLMMGLLSLGSLRRRARR